MLKEIGEAIKKAIERANAPEKQIEKRFKQLEQELTRLSKINFLTFSETAEVDKIRKEYELAQRVMTCDYMQKEINYIKSLKHNGR